MPAVDDEQGVAVATWMESIRTGEAADALAGAETVAEVEGPTLNMIRHAAACRMRTLSLVMDLLDGKAVGGELRDVVYAAFIPASESTVAT